MKWCDHHVRVGQIVTNLQSLEFVLRLFLYEENGERAQFPPQPGDDAIPKTWLTNDKSLSDVIGAYNEKLTQIEAPKFTVDDTVVAVRNALAHGRILSETPSPPVMLFKFGRHKKGDVDVPVQSVDELKEEWLNKKVALIAHQIRKVIKCARAREHEWPPDQPESCPVEAGEPPPDGRRR